MHFVVVYAKSEGRLLRVDDFENSSDAIDERFRSEAMHRGNPDVEVVVLSGESRAAIERTHARYFQPARDMVTTLLAARTNNAVTTSTAN